MTREIGNNLVGTSQSWDPNESPAETFFLAERGDRLRSLVSTERSSALLISNHSPVFSTAECDGYYFTITAVSPRVSDLMEDV